jgi:hypothetical protein
MSEGVVIGVGLDGIDDILSGTADADYVVGMGGDDTIFAAEGNDTLDGGEGNDTLDGGEGDDTFYTGEGSDIVYGGEGDDYVIYSDNFNSYDFLNDSDAFVVEDSDDSSVDTLHDVEYLTFGDLTLELDDATTLSSIEESVARLYNALLGRNPDNSGLNHWLSDLMVSNNSIQGMSGAFAGSEEYQARFGAQSDEAFIDQLYTNVLNRSADQAGYDYWLDEIAQSGDRSGMIVSFSESVEYAASVASEVSSYLSNVALDAFSADYLPTIDVNQDIIAGVRGNIAPHIIETDIA